MRHLLLAILLIIITLSCNKNKDNDNCDDFDATYDGDVRDILNRSCINGCHFFSSYETTLFTIEEREMEKRIFNPDSSALIMPPTSEEDRQLTKVEKEILKCWLDNGYPEK